MINLTPIAHMRGGCSVAQVPYEMPRSCLYMSPEWETAEVLLLLTHGTYLPSAPRTSHLSAARCCPFATLSHTSSYTPGSGNVRAGQWARKPCFNDSLQVRIQSPAWLAVAGSG